MDAGNAVVKLCADGMAAEAQGRIADARLLFAQAWRARTNDFEACVAAHYVARHQATLQETLHWNQEALRYADAVADDRVREFYPSLHLNVGDSLERLGRIDEACQHYSLAAARLNALPKGGYADMIRNSLAQRQSRSCVVQPSANA